MQSTHLVENGSTSNDSPSLLNSSCTILADTSTGTSASLSGFSMLSQSSLAYASECSSDRTTESSASASGSSTAICSQVEDGESNTSDLPSHYRCTAKSKHKIGYNRAWESRWPWLHFKENEGTLCSKHNANPRRKSGI